jgi:sialic acid synthase SpsE
MVYITADPGSCHGGNYCYAVDLIKMAKYCGADAIKFQLFKYATNGNIPLPYERWPNLVDEANKINIPIYASCFDHDAVELLYNTQCHSVKIAYSCRNYIHEILGKEINYFDKILVSGGMLDKRPEIENLIWYYCIPEYPVSYLPDFDGRFPKFDGFSDYTVGTNAAVNAVKRGAKYLEKHIRLDKEVNCPDYRFALGPNDFYHYCKEVRNRKI